MVAGTPGQEVVEGHHFGVRPVGQFTGQDLVKAVVAAYPGPVEIIEGAVGALEPAAEGPQGVFAVADQSIGLHVPSEFVPGIPAAQRRRVAVARGGLGQKLPHA
jgi:hypothetical protein